MASLEGWGSTIELHPQSKKHRVIERNSVQITSFYFVTCPDITPNRTLDDHSMPFDWARIGHESSERLQPFTSADPTDQLLDRFDLLQYLSITNFLDYEVHLRALQFRHL